MTGIFPENSFDISCIKTICMKCPKSEKLFSRKDKFKYIISLSYADITKKTCLFKHIENFTTRNCKFSDKNSDIFHIPAQNIDTR